MRYRPASNRPVSKRPSVNQLTEEFKVLAADGVFALSGVAGVGHTASRVTTSSDNKAAPQSEQKWLASEMSEPHVAQVGMAQTKMFR